ncbi:MAG: NINE protein [Nitritalea sp.]
MANVLRYLPELEGMELGYIQGLMKGMSEEKAQLFAQVYRTKRRGSDIVLILCLLGFAGFAGLHRLATQSILLGVLYFFTLGLCFIGTIVDLVNYKSIAYEYNIKMAYETLNVLQMSEEMD